LNVTGTSAAQRRYEGIPETPTIEALRMMRRLGVGCLPAVHEGKLVGLVTDEDFMDLAAKLLEDQIGSGEQLSLILERDGRVPDSASNRDVKSKKAATSDGDSDVTSDERGENRHP
jgi:CBS domain-containing protein